MTKAKAFKIIKLKQKYTTEEVAKRLKVPYSTVRYWMRIFKAEGYEVITHEARGRKPLLSK